MLLTTAATARQAAQTLAAERKTSRHLAQQLKRHEDKAACSMQVMWLPVDCRAESQQTPSES